MSIRARLAQPQHISGILEFAKRKHEESNYRQFQFNAVLARRTVKNAMTDKDCRCWIAVKPREDGTEQIVGVLIVELGPMAWIANLCATDTAFIADQGGDLLLDAFIAWCKLRKVARIDMGVSAGDGENKAVTRMFRRKGFSHSGGMYHLNFSGED